MDSTRREIEKRLKREMEAAREEYNSASQEFRQLLLGISGLSGAEGKIRATQISDAHSAALKKYERALARFNTYRAEGKLLEE
jgi:hypothetical protein